MNARWVMVGLAWPVALAVPAAAQDAVVTAAKPEKKICRREETVGTRLAPRTCRTAQDWKDIQGARRESLLEIADRAEREGRDAPTPYAKPQ